MVGNIFPGPMKIIGHEVDIIQILNVFIGALELNLVEAGRRRDGEQSGAQSISIEGFPQRP